MASSLKNDQQTPQAKEPKTELANGGGKVVNSSLGTGSGKVLNGCTTSKKK